MARRIKVFFIVLFASCLFSFPVHAEWSISDSGTLSDISLDIGLIKGTVNSIFQSIDGVLGVKYLLRDIERNLDVNWNGSFANVSYSKFSAISNTLDSIKASINQILAALSEIKSVLDQILAAFGWRGIAVYHVFQNSLEYCNSWDHGSRISNNAVVPTASGDFWQQPKINADNVGIAPGVYVVSVQTDVRWFFNGQSDWVTGAKTFTVKFDSISQLLFKFSSAPAWFILDIYPADSDQLGDQVFDKVGSSVSDVTSSVNSGVNQLEGLEDQVFGSLDTSLGSIDFSGSALGQVVSGFNFIRAVFSAVYSSSPYISVLINLSCMFGVLALFLRVQPRFSRWEREHRDRSS